MKRSVGVWLGGAALAILGGAAASLLFRAPPALDPALQLPASETVVDAEAVLHEQVEALIQAARGSEPVAQLPGFESVAMLAGRADQSWIAQRLTRDDVPAALVLGLARRLPRRQAGPARVAEILDPVLASGNVDAIDTAIGVLRTRGELDAKHHPRCGCSSGLYGGRWFLVWSARTGVGAEKEAEGFRALAVEGGPRALAVLLTD